MEICCLASSPSSAPSFPSLLPSQLKNFTASRSSSAPPRIVLQSSCSSEKSTHRSSSVASGIVLQSSLSSEKKTHRSASFDPRIVLQSLFPIKNGHRSSSGDSRIVLQSSFSSKNDVAGEKGEGGAPLAISIRNLALSVKGDRGDVLVLKECSLNVPSGQLWMLLGPNGCGKSTLLKAMAGLLRPSSGQMFVIGPRSFVFQNPDHQVVMPTAEADVAFGLGKFDLPLDEVRRRVYESLKAVGMAEYAQRSVQTLSGGQKQRIAIAGALAESSRMLLLDELTTYLDSGDQVGVLEAVRKVIDGPQPVTALWVTHRLEELDYADGAAYMENGRVVLSGSVSDIKAHIRHKQEEFHRGLGALK